MEKVIETKQFDTVQELIQLLESVDQDATVLDAHFFSIVETVLSDGSKVTDVRIR